MRKHGLTNEELEELMRASLNEEEVVSDVDDNVSENELSSSDKKDEKSH